ncbi:hypothetical protein [Mycobacterium sp. 141]|uniref:hypothetical protein n=1 Tax=Mycobacterium sp. 141 TaxID=1120797 RepID=UPI000374885C|nr:hypothetical protein [Mycobacterium sp. 141]
MSWGVEASFAHPPTAVGTNHRAIRRRWAVGATTVIVMAALTAVVAVSLNCGEYQRTHDAGHLAASSWNAAVTWLREQCG